MVKIKLSKIISDIKYKVNDLIFKSDKDTEIWDKNNTFKLKKFENDIKFIPGMITSNESELLLYLSMIFELKGDIIEIGSWMGRSTTFLAKGCMLSNNGVVHAIDTFCGNPGKEHLYKEHLKENETIYERFLKNIHDTGLENYVVVHKMTSMDARQLVKDPVRIIFIDGCHDYEAVKMDIELYHGLLKDNGYLLLHDYNKNSPGVVKAVSEFISNNDSYKIVILVDSLLVIKKCTGSLSSITIA